MLKIADTVNYLLSLAQNPLALANSIVVLPNRRAIKSFKEILLEKQGEATVFPYLYSVYEHNTNALPKPALNTKPVVSSLQREVLLTELLKQQNHPVQHTTLVENFLALIDELQLHEVSFSAINTLPVGVFSQHWQQSQTMLQQVLEGWHQHLGTEFLEPITGIQQFFNCLSTQIVNYPYPIIAAGTVTDKPYFKNFLASLQYAQNAHILLPAATEKQVPVFHPHYKIQMVQQCTSSPAKIATFEGKNNYAAAIFGEERLNIAPQHIAYDLYDDLHQEALCVALKMCQALENSGAHIALITADRQLANLVQQQLARWELSANDSFGIPLKQTVVGQFMLLLIEVLLRPSTATIMSFLKNPLLENVEKAIIFDIEKQAFRGQQFKGTLWSLKVVPYKNNKTAAFLVSLLATVQPLKEALATKNIAKIAAVQQEVLVALGTEKIWEGEDGQAACELLQNLSVLTNNTDDYYSILNAAMHKISITPVWNAHNRLHIWGPLEATMQHVDVVILAGLNEGIFPPKPKANPWLNRMMQNSIGLPAPEEDTGTYAQLFCELLELPQVHLSRADRVGGSPTLASPFLLNCTIGFNHTGYKIQDSQEVKSWAQELNTTVTQLNLGADFKSDALLRPNEISVTDINLLNKNPYAYYAKRVLNLRRLDDFEVNNLALDKGNILHEILEQFMQQHLKALPDDALNILRCSMDKALKNFDHVPMQQLFWQQQFYNVAAWFITNEQQQRNAGQATVSIEQKTTWQTNGITVVAKADRIDSNNTLSTIIDYKTGMAPTARAVESGQELQLAIEALMAEANAFGPLPMTGQLQYWQLKGKGQNKIQNVKIDEVFLATVDHYVQALLKHYLQNATAFEATGASPDYTHLERL